jgi:hypothetical protein
MKIILKISILLSALLISCVVKKNVESNMYSRPDIDLHDTDDDLEYLPEAGEKREAVEDKDLEDTDEEDDLK